MPDANVREQLGLQHLNTNTLEGGYVGGSCVQEQILQVLSISSQPILQALHKVARILRLLAGQVLEHCWQRAHLKDKRRHISSCKAHSPGQQARQVLFRSGIILMGNIGKAAELWGMQCPKTAGWPKGA